MAGTYTQIYIQIVFAVENRISLLEQGRTRMKPVSEIENIADLMEQYAIGSLYMSEAIAPQGRTGEAGDE